MDYTEQNKSSLSYTSRTQMFHIYVGVGYGGHFKCIHNAIDFRLRKEKLNDQVSQQHHSSAKGTTK